MTYRSVLLGLIIDDTPISQAAADYAVSFCEREKAHLTVQLAVPIVDLPSNRLVPLLHAVIDQVNADRLSKAKAEQERIKVSARLAGFTLTCTIMQSSYRDIRGCFITLARLSDIVIIERPTRLLSSEKGFIEGVLFSSGRPILVVSPEWPRGSSLRRIVVAWDGGQYAARAIGDALPLLSQADEVQIVCISPDSNKSMAGADVARHLARHGTNPELIELETVFGDPSRTLSDHLATVTPDLLVMGAYAHSRLIQFFLGGMTDSMLNDAHVPVLYSH